MIFYLNDYNGGTLSVCDYLFERIKIETRAKTVRQSAYLIVKGLLKKKTTNDAVFNALDDLFDIPKKEKRPQKSKEELMDEFEKYVKGV